MNLRFSIWTGRPSKQASNMSKKRGFPPTKERKLHPPQDQKSQQSVAHVRKERKKERSRQEKPRPETACMHPLARSQNIENVVFFPDLPLG